MKKLLLLTLAVYLLQMQLVDAQSRVFKEVGEEISSQIKAIQQDGALVGYVIFTQLEKASEDSFNYKVSILDENLNDIGAVNFRDLGLSLQSVAFEQDVLCLGYLRSNLLGRDFKNPRQYRRARDDQKSAAFIQFLSLDGKIIKSQSNKLAIDFSRDPAVKNGKYVADGKLKHDLRISNVSQKGFACFYGDVDKNTLQVYNVKGDQVWQKTFKEDAEGFVMLTSGTDIYLLEKKKDQMLEGGYELLGYNTADSSAMPKYVLKDKQGNSLKPLAFDNDPVSGRPYITGYVINPSRGNKYLCGKNFTKGTYSGVFTLNINGHKKGDIGEIFSYWQDGSQPGISKRGRYEEIESYARYVSSFRDYQGNTYFAGSSVIKRTRWGLIAACVITAPTVIIPLVILPAGTHKYKIRDAVLLQQNPKGNLNLSATIPANNSMFISAQISLFYIDQRTFYTLSNAETKTNYIVLDDVKDIVIYNVNQKKVTRKIPHKDGNVLTYVYPAKEGHLLVSEYNKKEKYTRFSIESL